MNLLIVFDFVSTVTDVAALPSNPTSKQTRGTKTTVMREAIKHSSGMALNILDSCLQIPKKMTPKTFVDRNMFQSRLR